ncbi:hypothetical protein HanHA300_Chr00c0039g0686641 [Helianthus annuus]|nr:hypothetical protein HanHA300_Chr00c1072g0837551 [Helianthus annuus]KAJ0629470.1 hypothetical protein HanHA89_Chr00c20g0752721 [Helianthus annuus]KAJ0630242.1 hypothetical protein HanHA300_Chr00c0375g0753111 [Helianthus annuus]KAJ0638486.1 hypothetical protein HanHA300_Chr00c0110g0711231 [Helianthus annuus]KAJ0638819.1 hypothetical protein HanHA300_Chr00c0039g0686641 [Helianthus annuus]
MASHSGWAVILREARTLNEGRTRIPKDPCPHKVPYPRYQAMLNGPQHQCMH